MSIKLEVWGDYACFSRPEMKAERVSYDVITPSAARGLIEAIYWHPGLKYVIDKIHVCAPICFTNIRRNETKAMANRNNIKRAMETGEDIYISTSDNINQRAAMILRDVHYVIEAHFVMTKQAASSDNPGKFQDILKRRIEKGQCYHQPYFGMKEFPAYFKMCEKIPECPEELKGEKDLGWMLHDLDYSNPEEITPKFFRATIKDGVVVLPSFNDEEVV